MLSVAHSHRDRGAANPRVGVAEYELSVRASEAAAAHLRQRDCPVVLLDAADNLKHAPIKIVAARALNPSLAVEIHFNSNENVRANYGEVIHRARDAIGMRAALTVSDHLRDTLKATQHAWPWHGARADDRNLFFINKTNCPSIITEALFVSNDEQARWVLSSGGAEAIGTIIGEGISLFIEREKL